MFHEFSQNYISSLKAYCIQKCVDGNFFIILAPRNFFIKKLLQLVTFNKLLWEKTKTENQKIWRISEK